jgi:hypothetical protein
VQGSGLYFGLRAVVAHLRRRGFSRGQVKLMFGPIYLVTCFITNILALLAVHMIRKW